MNRTFGGIAVGVPLAALAIGLPFTFQAIKADPPQRASQSAAERPGAAEILSAVKVQVAALVQSNEDLEGGNERISLRDQEGAFLSDIDSASPSRIVDTIYHEDLIVSVSAADSKGEAEGSRKDACAAGLRDGYLSCEVVNVDGIEVVLRTAAVVPTFLEGQIDHVSVVDRETASQTKGLWIRRAAEVVVPASGMVYTAYEMVEAPSVEAAEHAVSVPELRKAVTSLAVDLAQADLKD